MNPSRPCPAGARSASAASQVPLASRQAPMALSRQNPISASAGLYHSVMFALTRHAFATGCARGWLDWRGGRESGHAGVLESSRAP